MTDQPKSWFTTGLTCRCPRCGEGPLFMGFLKLHHQCTHCQLDYSGFDSADGPAVFVMFIAGFLVVAAAIIVEVIFAPSYWVHLALWIPFTVIVSMLLLRPFKATLIALQYVNDAAEGRLADKEDE